MAECKDNISDPNKSQEEGREPSTTDTLHNVTAGGQKSSNPNTSNQTGDNVQLDVDLQNKGCCTQSDENQNVKINEFSNQAGQLIRDGSAATSMRPGENETDHKLFNQTREIIFGQDGTGRKENPAVTTSYVQPDVSYSFITQKNLSVFQPPMPPKPTMVRIK